MKFLFVNNTEAIRFASYGSSEYFRLNICMHEPNNIQSI